MELSWSCVRAIAYRTICAKAYQIVQLHIVYKRILNCAYNCIPSIASNFKIAYASKHTIAYTSKHTIAHRIMHVSNFAYVVALCIQLHIESYDSKRTVSHVALYNCISIMY